MDLKQSIKIYGLSADNFETSPFEALDMLHRRSQLEQRKNEFTAEERELLKEADDILLKNAEKMCKHISQVYRFDDENNNKSLTQWWWHLDKVLRGDIVVDNNDNTVLLMGKESDQQHPIRKLVEFKDEAAYQRFIRWCNEDSAIREIRPWATKEGRKYIAMQSRHKRRTNKAR